MTAANMITILRFVLVPAVVYWLLTGEWQLAFAGFLVAGISDGVDGFVARHFNQRSKLGGYLDPMADKLLLVSVFVVLGFLGELPLWLVIVGGEPRRADRLRGTTVDRDGQSGRDEAADGFQGQYRGTDRACRRRARRTRLRRPISDRFARP